MDTALLRLMLFSLCVISASGQANTWQDLASVRNFHKATATELTPATYGGYFWIEPSRIPTVLGTNGSLVVISNLAATGSSLDLTNETFASTGLVVQVSNLNGLATLGFKGFNAFRATNYTVGIVTQEVFMLMSVTNLGGASRGFFGGMTSTNGYSLRYFNSTRTLDMQNSSAGGTAVQAPTNSYVLYDMIFGDSASGHLTIFSNGVAGLSPTINKTNMFGLLFASRLSDSAGAFSLATFFTFTQQLSAVDRSTMVWYCTNRFSTNGFAFGQ